VVTEADDDVQAAVLSGVNECKWGSERIRLTMPIWNGNSCLENLSTLFIL